VKDKEDLKKDAEDVKSKLAILKMKASILRAGGELQAAVPRAPLGTIEAGTQTEPWSAERMGTAVSFLDSLMSQDRAVDLVRRATGPVAVLAYTFDRADLAEALVQARSRGLAASIGVDRRFSLNGRCKEQEQNLRMLQASGVAVKLLDGGPSGPFYREVGRTQSGFGIAHAKVAIATVPEGSFAVVGSTNWTTSSRANLETGVLIELSETGASELWAMIGARLKRGAELLPALRDREIARSLTPRRARSQSQARGASSSAGIPEEEEELFDPSKGFDRLQQRGV
jgi:phosphatidylserine/phosphatidylglycerophosphate/cardiolipin synthase-like enzyme